MADDKQKTNKKESESHSGHRARLIEKMSKQTLCEHEYLEALLFNAVPRRNTNDLAHRLLERFGSVLGVLTAELQQLKTVDGVGDSIAAYLYCIGRLIRKYGETTREGYEARFAYSTFLKYVKKEYAFYKTEVADLYLLDTTGFVYAKRRFTLNAPGSVAFCVRQLNRIIVEDMPTGVVLVHNHPIGEANPSSADDQTTAEIEKVCEQNGVVFCDHLIYSQKGVYSYKFNKRIEDFAQETGAEGTDELQAFWEGSNAE